jgi:predicted TIM-barrel fold metal-dependent hydrolase
MRIVALEEHFTVPRHRRRHPHRRHRRPRLPHRPLLRLGADHQTGELGDPGDARLADMDASFITVQVLSVAGAGADLVPRQKGIDLARAYNDALAEAAARHPARYR